MDINCDPNGSNTTNFQNEITQCHILDETALSQTNATGLPFGAMHRKVGIRGPIMLPSNRHDINELLRECMVYVSPPTDKDTLARINR